MGWSILTRKKLLTMFHTGTCFRHCRLSGLVPLSSLGSNGLVTAPFAVTRSVRQGCGLSPLLYVLCIEPLAYNFRTNPGIRGLSLPGCNQTLKVTQYADDTTCVIADVSSLKIILDVFSKYERASGAALNLEKCVGMWVSGAMGRRERYCGIPFMDSTIRCLGVFFSPDRDLMRRKNWGVVYDKCESVVKGFRGRWFSVRGSAIVIGSLLCSKIWHVGRVVHINKYWLCRLNSLMFWFLWSDGANNTDRVNRLTTVQPVSKGGLAVPCIFSKLQAFDIVHVVNLFFSENDAKWKYFAVFFAGQALRKWKPAFASNLIPHSGVIPPFYTEVLVNFKLMFCEIMGEETSALRASSTRGVYGKFLARKNVVPLVEQKLLGRGLNFSVIWENVSNGFVSPDLRCLGWRTVHGVLPVREKLHRQQLFISALCPLCRVGVETPQHIFWECPVVLPFLNRV